MSNMNTLPSIKVRTTFDFQNEILFQLDISVCVCVFICALFTGWVEKRAMSRTSEHQSADIEMFQNMFDIVSRANQDVSVRD